MSGALRPAGSPCPACGAPIARRRSASDPGAVMMRCPACGWSGVWRRPGAAPRDGSPAEVAADLGWLGGRGGEVLAFRPRGR